MYHPMKELHFVGGDINGNQTAMIESILKPLVQCGFIISMLLVDIVYTPTALEKYRGDLLAFGMSS